MFNPRVNTTLHTLKIPNILVTFNLFFFISVGSRPGHKIFKQFILHLCGSVCEEFLVNLVNLRWAVAKISCVYGKKIVCYKKNKLDK